MPDSGLKPDERPIPKAHKEGGLIAGVCIALAAVIFPLDIIFQLGMAIPLLYTAPIWLAGMSNDRRLTLAIAGTCALFTVFGLHFSPPGNAMWSTILTNRMLYLSVIFMITILILQERKKEKQLIDYSESLEDEIQKRTAQLRKAHSAALQTERLAAIGQMVTGLAHESKNALQRIQSSINRLYRRVHGDEQLARIVGDIEDASDDVARLYEEVKSYAAPIQLDKVGYNVSHIWKKVWKDLAPVRSDRDISLIEETNDVDLVVPVDSFRLGQVFRNVLENSINACPDPATIRITTQTTVANDIPVLQVTIADSGPGLEKQVAEQIFTPFFTTKSKGTGLGMAIAKRVMEAHDGEIEINETVEKGCEFVLILPRD
jgi:signal transduction histidine kinase